MAQHATLSAPLSATTYAAQRAQLIGSMPHLAALLPAEPPCAPAVRTMERRELRALLMPAANTHAELVMVMGWGDGSVPLALLGDPVCRQKRLHVLLFAGEEQAFAATFARPVLELLSGSQLTVTVIEDEQGIADMVIGCYPHHHHIPPLAGCDFIDAHPLTAPAAAFRAQHLARINELLADRTQAYGNDILDSFTGLIQASRNARQLLPAPTIGELAGRFGDIPVISIAAGPSVKRRLDQLRALQDRCILIACDAALHGLLDQGIDPHFVTPLERLGNLAMFARAGESRAIYAGLPVVHPDVVGRFPAERTIGVYCGDALYPWLVPDPGRRINAGQSTGVLSVTVGAALTTGPLFLVGHDLARGENGSHWEGAGTAGNAWKEAKQRSESAKLTGFYTDRLIPGNGDETVRSTMCWDHFRTEIAYEAQLLKAKGRTVYNVNAHDRIFARIDHTAAAPLPDPASLPKLPALTLPAREPARFAQWSA
ncbi:MAG: DUF115 domain-containing protein, partial [Planctomycetes bacterium]|nr:DUF115 domain-containing protein [Planctomycetota bacterium]